MFKSDLNGIKLFLEVKCFFNIDKKKWIKVVLGGNEIIFGIFLSIMKIER